MRREENNDDKIGPVYTFYGLNTEDYNQKIFSWKKIEIWTYLFHMNNEGSLTLRYFISTMGFYFFTQLCGWQVTRHTILKGSTQPILGH